MAFTRETMALTGHWANNKQFLYTTPDSHTTAFASGYFNEAVEKCNLETGNVIVAVCGFGGTMVLRMYVATVNASTGVVTTTQLITT